MALRQQRAASYSSSIVAYHLHHSWATRALRNGVDSLTAAILLGHSNPKVLAEVYQHLAQAPDHLRSAAERAFG